METRLNKLLADLGYASRRAADALIEAGRVTVNGRKAKLGEKVDPLQMEIQLEGKKIQANKPEELEYWLFHKPVGVLSTLQDPEGRRSLQKYIRTKTEARLFPVGRLDSDSEGLLLLTNDGELAFRLTHPKYAVSKEYQVWVNGIFAQGKLERLRRGVYLREGKTAFDEVEIIEKTGRDFVLHVKIHEGKKREIRRVCAKVGWEVQRLQRQRLAGLELGNLGAGQMRKLSAEELALLKHAVAL